MIFSKNNKFEHSRLSLPIIWLTLLAGLILIVSGCQSSTTSSVSPASLPVTSTTAIPSVKTLVSPVEAQNLIAANQGSTDFVIVDVRTADEFSTGHLAGALNIDIYQSDFKSKIAELARNKKYLVYCRTGIRSAQASADMIDLGFSHIYDLSGGITEWVQEGKPTVK
jgi:rhodanese-related sulfurtransferase